MDAPAAERERVLAEVCGGDPELLREAKALVAAASQGDGFLEPLAGTNADGGPSPSGPPDGASALETGEQLGPFRLAARPPGCAPWSHLALDAGGAHLHLGVLAIASPGAAAVQRLRSSGPQLGRLEHPAIAGLRDLGLLRLPDGRPAVYLATDLPSGAKPLAAAHSESDLDSSARARLRTALDHAHAAGLPHDGIEAGSIWVDPAGQPVWVDWGLAWIARGPVVDPAAARRGDIEALGRVLARA